MTSMATSRSTALKPQSTKRNSVADIFARLERREIDAEQAATELRQLRRRKSRGIVRFIEALAE